MHAPVSDGTVRRNGGGEVEVVHPTLSINGSRARSFQRQISFVQLPGHGMSLNVSRSDGLALALPALTCISRTEVGDTPITSHGECDPAILNVWYPAASSSRIEAYSLARPFL
jgi:hypothetical protein